MKITKKQFREIEFLCYIKDIPLNSVTQEEKEHYILNTVHGKRELENRIIEAKRWLDITISQWREDLSKGLLLIYELDEEYSQFEHWKGLRKGILKSITNKYKMPKKLNDTERGIIGIIMLNLKEKMQYEIQTKEN